MDADPRINIMYAAKYAGTANYWKYFIGQTRGLKRLKVVQEKQSTESALMNWIDQSAERKAKYGEAMQMIKQG
ncbi:MAG TPA: S46 family peptidase, partial [Bacteroidales bacterium]|nr:S46 family peptidase [Bacteroidales bacterium]